MSIDHSYSCDFGSLVPVWSSSDSSILDALSSRFLALSRSSFASSSCSFASFDIRESSDSSMSYLIGKFAAAPLGTHIEAVIIDIIQFCARFVVLRLNQQRVASERFNCTFTMLNLGAAAELRQKFSPSAALRRRTAAYLGRLFEVNIMRLEIPQIIVCVSVQVSRK